MVFSNGIALAVCEYLLITRLWAAANPDLIRRFLIPALAAIPLVIGIDLGRRLVDARQCGKIEASVAALINKRIGTLVAVTYLAIICSATMKG